MVIPGTKVQNRRIDLQKLFFNNVLAFSPSSRAPASRCHCTLGRLGFPHSSSIIVFPALGSQLGDVFLQKLFYNFRHTRWKCSLSNQRIAGHFITPTPLISSSRSCVNFPPLVVCFLISTEAFIKFTTLELLGVLLQKNHEPPAYLMLYCHLPLSVGTTVIIGYCDYLGTIHKV